MPIETVTRIHPVYFLYGPEDYLIEQEVQKLLDRTLSQKEREMNLHVFSGEEHRGQEIVQACQTLPMFSRSRFVLVKGAGDMDEEDVGALAKYIQDPSPNTCLVLWAQGLGPWKGHRSQIEKVGKVEEHSRLKGKALISWMKGRMSEKGKTLSEEGAAHLVEVIGDHLHLLDNALEQIYLGAGEKKIINLPEVEGVVSDVKVSTVFDLSDAIGRQDVLKALAILEQVLESKTVPFKKDEEATKMQDPIPLLLGMMARQYRMIWRTQKMVSERMKPEDMAKALRMSPWTVRKLIDQARNFSPPSLREGILKCHRTDLAVKKSRGPKNLLMEKLVIDLCRPSVT
jgi:DNA polymerase III subunit delta